ncbi:hypothetical protein I8752_01870 [Nostocaceae cyanobacterium CENA369]|uniref:Uncharacterized protein n=1 Tax=Dendronalium phyllosphericum CENA369 TaxID=1725256 RepID=A0A8J7HZ32_9NOST|nr:hypothetical protein [Dendronalium phyllosphericum]MBH8571795.1 hypothetical protein [Dendronalium phyllosphericum CENA369]
MCLKYGLKPTGNAGYNVAYIASLMAFSAIALNQYQEARGLKRLTCSTSEIDRDKQK